MINAFLAGACCMGYLVAAVFFLKFWGKSADRLFFMFALAFFLFALERAVQFAVPGDSERYPYVYLVRLAGFCVIIIGIIGKNRRSGPGS
jgi:hypothetical protein